MISDLRRYLRPEPVLLLLVVLCAAGMFYLTRESNSVEEEQKQTNTQKLQTETGMIRLEDDKFLLETKLGTMESEISPLIFPSRDVALELSGKLARYLDDNNLQVSAFDSNQTVELLNNASFEAVNFSLIAQGPPESLIGILAIIDDTPTGIVRTLDLTRTSDVLDTWTLSLGLVVVYGKELEGGS